MQVVLIIIFTIIILFLLYLVAKPFIDTAREKNINKKKNRMHIDKKK